MSTADSQEFIAMETRDSDHEDGGHDNNVFSYANDEDEDADAPNGSLRHDDADEDVGSHVPSDETAEIDGTPDVVHGAGAAYAMDHGQIDVDKMKEAREVMFFEQGGQQLRIDYVLVYKDDPKKPDNNHIRDTYLQNLEAYDLVVHRSPDVDITDHDLHYVLLHAPWDVLLVGAEMLAIKKRLKMPQSLARKVDRPRSCNYCEDSCRKSQQYIPEEGDFFTAPMHRDRLDLFEIEDQETFFTNAERSLIVKEVLDRTSFTDEAASISRFGIMRLLQEGIYESAYPLHEGRFTPIDGVVGEAAFEGPDKDRALLYETWARPARCFCRQPIDLIRKYFGEKIGLYFAWLGYYTEMLIPATLFGLIAFIYGLITLFADPVSMDICDNFNATVMCPQCNLRCKYWKLKESCIYSQITYLFDNYATVAYTFLMTLWAICFLEFWKRKQYELQYEWDVQDFEAQERMRPEFEFKVTKRKENPITREEEPYITTASKCCRSFTSISIALFFAFLVIGAILGVIVYRMVVVTLLYGVDIEFISTWAKIITSITASVINLIVIMILGQVYKRVALMLTNLEMHRTETDFEDAYSFKMFLFQFANYYGTTFYIAFFKGKFQAEPGSTRFYLFGKFEPDACDPSGCMIDLLIQLFIVMVGKQALNQIKEIVIPKICVCMRQRKAKKDEADGGLYMRWMQDRDMQEVDRLMLFEEYLEMVIQYGFVTIFVAAFPLAPLFALLNNVVEIRLDAYKLVTQYKRPAANRAQDIGVWFGILQSVTFIAILTNAVIIAWTSDFVPRMVYIFGYSQDYTLRGYINNSLSLFDTSDFSAGTAPKDPGDGFANLAECSYKGYRHAPDSATPYLYTEQFWQVLVARLAFILIFEHACFLITYIVSYMIPDRPAHVRRLEAYEKALNRHLTFKSTFQEIKDHKRQSQNFGY